MSTHGETIYDQICAYGQDALHLSHKLSQVLAQTPQEKYACNIQVLCGELIQAVGNLYDYGQGHPEDREFWSNSRHLLRSPLNAIQGYAEILLEELPESEAPPLVKLVDISRYLLPLINSIHSLGDFTKKPDLAEGKNYSRMTLNENPIHHLDIVVVTQTDDLVPFLTAMYPMHGFRSESFENLGAVSLEALVLIDARNLRTTDLSCLKLWKPWISTHKVALCLEDGNVGLESGAMQEFLGLVDDCICGSLESLLPKKHLDIWIARCLADVNHRDAMRRLRHVYEVLGTTIENLDSAFVMTDAHDRVVLCNNLFKRTYPYLRDLQLGSVTYEQFLQRHMEEGFYDYQNQSPQDWFKAQVHDRANLLTTIQQLTDGRWIRLVHSRSSDGGMTSLHTDVTDQKNDAERLTFLAGHDALTNLPNRTFLDKRANQILSTAMERGLSCAVLYFDLDGFKAINDTHGHPMGDELLVEIAHRLTESCRSKDAMARLGGDEFVVVLSDLKNEKEASLLAKRITKDIGTRYIKDGVTVHFSVSMGIALYPSDASTFAELLIQADQAMYHAKKLGKARICSFRDVEKIAFLTP